MRYWRKVSGTGEMYEVLGKSMSYWGKVRGTGERLGSWGALVEMWIAGCN